MPGAKKSRFSKSGRENSRRYGRKRKVGGQSPRPVVVVVCDDAKTAPNYFREFSKQVKGKVTVRVEPKPCDTASASEVVKHAINQLEKLKADSSVDDTTAVWVLIDLESDPALTNQGHKAKKQAEKAGVNVALSLPCFEVWTLLHLVDTGEGFMDCAAVIAKLEAEWQKEFGQAMGPKAQAAFSKIMDRIPEAISNAKKQQEHKVPSWTEVHKPVEEIMNLAG